MRLRRIYCPIDLKHSQSIDLPLSAHHHITKVLRLKPENELLLFNGDGYNYHAKLTKVVKNYSQVKILKTIKNDVESPLKIHLVQGIARGEKMDFIIQKAVEIGVNEITPIFCQFGNVKIPDERRAKRIAHWQNVANSATEQSGRSILTKINPPNDFFTAIHAISQEKNYESQIILTPNAINKLNTLPQLQSILICIGPEGGFSDDELNYAEEKSFQKIQLGPRVLRTETAGIVVITYCQTHYGDI
ncbi:MAG: 16S rRNA (uracil(1498)-N(3))-methyltransferase [Pseudomonadota bacterium]